MLREKENADSNHPKQGKLSALLWPNTQGAEGCPSKSSLGSLPPLKDAASKFSSWATAGLGGENRNNTNGTIDTEDELLMFENETLTPRGAAGL
jgi:hypothetical protein